MFKLMHSIYVFALALTLIMGMLLGADPVRVAWAGIVACVIVSISNFIGVIHLHLEGFGVYRKDEFNEYKETSKSLTYEVRNLETKVKGLTALNSSKDSEIQNLKIKLGSIGVCL